MFEMHSRMTQPLQKSGVTHRSLLVKYRQNGFHNTIAYTYGYQHAIRHVT